MKKSLSPPGDFIDKVVLLLKNARQNVVSVVNHTMVSVYYEIGKTIVDEEQQGKERAEYGKKIMSSLSTKLTSEFGKGFSQRNLEQMRQFYLTYSKTQTVFAELKLSWSHYLFLIRIDNVDERRFYEIEASENNWSLRELQRQFGTALYERLALSKDKTEVKNLSEKGQVMNKAQDAIKDPYVLEFLGLPEEKRYSETELEQKLIDRLETFLLELGKGYAFVGRQVRFSFDDKHFRVDLVFYNRILQCFVLVDLKIGEVSHQDLGQMQTYVNYYDRFIRLEHENRTIGIVLCKKKNDSLVEITLPENNEQIFASKYQTVLPSKKVLKQLIDRKSE